MYFMYINREIKKKELADWINVVGRWENTSLNWQSMWHCVHANTIIRFDFTCFVFTAAAFGLTPLFLCSILLAHFVLWVAFISLSFYFVCVCVFFLNHKMFSNFHWVVTLQDTTSFDDWIHNVLLCGGFKVKRNEKTKLKDNTQ